MYALHRCQRGSRLHVMVRAFTVSLLACAVLDKHLAKAIGAYQITDLGTLGGAESYPSGINNSGQIVGWSYTGQVVSGLGQHHAFLYQNGNMTDLGSLGTGISSEATAINDLGQIVGESFTNGDGPQHAFVWNSGAFTDLGVLGGGPTGISVAYGINSQRQIVGMSTVNSAEDLHAFLYENGSMSDLGTLGGSDSNAVGINGDGKIVGGASSATAGPLAFRYQNGVMTSLGTLGGFSSYARGTDASGQIVGAADLPGGSWHAFLYDSDHMSDLGTLAGKLSEADAINGIGQVVGRSQIADDATFHAFLYQNGTMSDLNGLIDPGSGWTLTSASGINDLGWIIGGGRNSRGEIEAYLLTPVPDPALSGMTVAGCLLVLTSSRRRGAHRMFVSS